MKKILLLSLLAVAALFVIAACAPKEAGEEGALAGQAGFAGQCSPLVQNAQNCTDSGTSVSGIKSNGQSFSYTDSCTSNNKKLREHQCFQSSTQCPANAPAGQCPAPTWMVVRCTKSCPSGQPCNPAALVCGNCGNGAVDSGENCVSCPADVPCADGEMCDTVNQECVAIEEEEAPVEEGEEGAFGDGSTPPAPPACPSGTEACDGCDNDGDKQTDEGCDDDNDDYCDSSMTLVGTPAVCPLGGGDCKDNYSNSHLFNPGRPEDCFAEGDENCDGVQQGGCVYSCQDDDSSQDQSLGGTITYVAEVGGVQQTKTPSKAKDHCIASGPFAGQINQTTCPTGQTFQSLYDTWNSKGVETPCTTGTCTDSDGVEGTPAVCQ